MRCEKLRASPSPGPAARRRWRFEVEDVDEVRTGVDADGGERNADEYFIGMTAEAEAEAERRADLWELGPTGKHVARVTYESYGIERD